MEKLWHHVFYDELQVAPEEHDLLLSEPPFTSRSTDTLLHDGDEKLCEVLYEHFGVRALYVSKAAVLALYQSGRTTGLVVDCGADRCVRFPKLCS